jgi:hypothetical protein
MKCDAVAKELEVLEGELLSIKEHLQRANFLLVQLHRPSLDPCP